MIKGAQECSDNRGCTVPLVYMSCHYKSSRSKFIVVKKLSTYTMMSFVSYIFS